MIELVNYNAPYWKSCIFCEHYCDRRYDEYNGVITYHKQLSQTIEYSPKHKYNNFTTKFEGCIKNKKDFNDFKNDVRFVEIEKSKEVIVNRFLLFNITKTIPAKYKKVEFKKEYFRIDNPCKTNCEHFKLIKMNLEDMANYCSIKSSQIAIQKLLRSD